MKPPPGKKDPQPKTLGAKTSAPEKIPPRNGITRLKLFQSKLLTTGPGEKIVSSIKRREIGVQAVGVNFFFLFVLCISINVHLVYLLTYIFSIS